MPISARLLKCKRVYTVLEEVSVGEKLEDTNKRYNCGQKGLDDPLFHYINYPNS